MKPLESIMEETNEQARFIYPELYSHLGLVLWQLKMKNPKLAIKSP